MGFATFKIQNKLVKIQIGLEIANIVRNLKSVLVGLGKDIATFIGTRELRRL
jgi:hypothetical protein